MKKLILITILIIILLPHLINAKKKTSIIINKDETGLALKGYDAVSYFTENKAVKGSTKYSFEYLDAIWLFSSEKYLKLFKDNPGNYIPQYGGYCAYAMAKGYKAPVDPNIFNVINNKLYLNYDAKTENKWKKNMEQYIIKADKNWLKLIKK